MSVVLLWPKELEHWHILMLPLLTDITGGMQRQTDSDKCIKTHWMTFQHSVGQQTQTFGQSKQQAFQDEEAEYPQLAESIT